MKWHLMYEGPRLSHLLAKHIFLNPYLSKELKKLTGFQDRDYFWYSDSKTNLHAGFYVKKDMNLAKQYGYKFFNQSMNSWVKSQDKLHKETKRLMKKYKLELGVTLSKKRIIELIPKLAKLRSKLFVYVLSCQPQCTDGLQEELRDLLNCIKNKNERENAFLKLTLPEKKSFFTYENIDWIKLINKVKNKQQKDPLIAKHFKKYFLIPASDRTEPWDLNYFQRQLEKDLTSKQNYLSKLCRLENQYDNVLEIKKSIIKKYNLPKKAFILGRKIAEIGYFRFLSSYYGRWIGYYFVMICRYLENDNLNFWELTSMDENELINYIKLNKFDKKQLQKRALAQTILIKNNKISIFFGEKAIKKRKEELKEIDYSNVKELKGEIGCQGKETGKAFVFHWNDDINNKINEMPDDSILIAPQTHPTYLPAMYRAKAFATDEGGVTGHAAIVARELNKPCVIGLHTVTKAIKTGDIIEVDANKGIVKVLKRCNHSVTN